MEKRAQYGRLREFNSINQFQIRTRGRGQQILSYLEAPCGQSVKCRSVYSGERMSSLESPHVPRVAGVLQAVLVALEEKLEEEPAREKRSLFKSSRYLQYKSRWDRINQRSISGENIVTGGEKPTAKRTQHRSQSSVYVSGHPVSGTSFIKPISAVSKSVGVAESSLLLDNKNTYDPYLV